MFMDVWTFHAMNAAPRRLAGCGAAGTGAPGDADFSAY